MQLETNVTQSRNLLNALVPFFPQNPSVLLLDRVFAGEPAFVNKSFEVFLML